jgi:Protein of unknown function (DUF3703)
MSLRQRQAFARELGLGRSELRAGAFESARHHLERAHVLGQREVVPHVHAHLLLLELELRQHQPRAALGQVVRIALGALGSALGRVPTGNTGGSDVSMFRLMPIPADLLEQIDPTP